MAVGDIEQSSAVLGLIRRVRHAATQADCEGTKTQALPDPERGGPRLCPDFIEEDELGLGPLLPSIEVDRARRGRGSVSGSDRGTRLRHRRRSAHQHR